MFSPRRLAVFGLVSLFVCRGLAAEPPDAHLLAGTWRYNPERSTALSSWGSLKLMIKVEGPRVILTREYSAGRRTFVEVTPIDLSSTINVVPFEWWPDNRHLGAYAGGDRTKKLRFRVLNEGRLLRTSADIVLATQQGEHPVNILSDYKLSPKGDHLILTELRSTRDDPIVYVFDLVANPAADAAASKGNAE